MKDSLTLALFPLSVVVFPGEQILLHVFEPRYKELIQQCSREGTLFGIPFVHDGKIQEMGTVVRLVQITKTYDNGEMDIVVEGIRIFETMRYYGMLEGHLYPGGEVQLVAEGAEPSVIEPELLRQFKSYMELKGLELEDWEVMKYFTAFDMIRRIKLGNKDKYRLLCERSELRRQQWLAGVIRYLNYLLRQEKKSFKDNVYLN